MKTTIEVLCAACFGVLIAIATPVKADTASNGRDSVTRELTPCVNMGILKHLTRVPPQMIAMFQAGTAMIEGKQFAMCWIEYQGFVLIQYEDGEVGRVPLGDFRKDIKT